MLVECPHCHTKFAIAANITSSKKARFHCSRCDFYFEAIPQAPQSVVKSSAESKDQENKKSAKTRIEKLSFNLKDFSNKTLKRKKDNKKNLKIKKEEDALQISLDLDKRGPEIIRDKRALMLICSIPFCLSLLIGSVSWKIKDLPEIVKKPLLLSRKGLVQAPPAGLELTNIDFQENPNRKIEIRGEIMNTTFNSYVDLKIKTVFYDQDNSKISEFLSSHKELVESNSKDNFRIKLADAPEEGIWYATSIYSLREVPL